MNLRLTCVVALIALAGCGGQKTPTQVAETPLPATDVTADPGTDSAPQPSGPGVPGDSGTATQSGDSNEAEPAATLESLTTSLQQSIQREDYAGALRFADRALELDPENLSLLFMATQLSQHLGMQQAQSGTDRQAANALFFKSADFVRRMLKADNDLPKPQLQFLSQVFYNEACAHASGGENEKALASLSAALDAGFEDYRQIDSDPDLEELRKTPAFEQLVAARREEHRQQLLARVKEEIAAHKPFEFDFSLVSTQGATVKLADYKGKVLIVDFWGTWCPPCRQEIPHFVELLGKHRAAGLEIVGINYENGDPEGFSELINTFAKENGVTYPCLLGDEATQQRVPNLDGFPTTLFIDRSGKVRLRVVGYHSYEDLEAIVQTLLSETEGTTGG